MVQTGLIFLLGALAVSKKGEIWKPAILLMVALFLWGFVNGMWYIHPLGAMISVIGGGWVIYRATKSKKNETGDSHMSHIKKFFQKIPQNVKQRIKWVGVPLSILLVLWLFKSILLAFIIGFGVVAFFDRQSVRVKGLNHVAVILLLYTVGFLILLVGTFKIDVAYNYPNFEFFTKDAYISLRDIMRGL